MRARLRASGRDGVGGFAPEGVAGWRLRSVEPERGPADGSALRCRGERGGGSARSLTAAITAPAMALFEDPPRHHLREVLDALARHPGFDDGEATAALPPDP